MSRVAKKPVPLPQGVTATVAADAVTLKGAKGSLSLKLVAGVSVAQDKQTLTVHLPLFLHRSGCVQDEQDILRKNSRGLRFGFR